MPLEELSGRWQQTSIEGVEEFLKLIPGVTEEQIRLSLTCPSEVDINKLEDTWTIITKVANRRRIVTFPKDQFINTISLNGDAVKARLVEEKGRLVEQQNLKEGTFTIRRYIKQGRMYSELRLNNKFCKVCYHKVETFIK